jgi:peptide/nickel transport system substrate-binding protein
VENSYWVRQLSRRRLLRGAGAAGLAVGAASLIGCGGGADEEEQDHGLVTPPVDTSRQAKRGGIFADHVVGDETNLDPISTIRGAGTGGVETAAYQKLLREKEFAGGTKSQVFEGDVAESYELSDDGLRLVAKLRPNNRFDPRPPTSGRVLNAQDVVYSWDKMVEVNTYASTLANKKDPAVPIESATATDSRTVVYKMAFPWSALLAGLAEGGPHQIAPIEAEDKFKPQTATRGSGPWMLDYEPSVAFRWRRNPGYFLSDVPYLEGFDQPILPEYATRLAQFRAKGIWNLTPNPADLPATMRDLPSVQAYQDEIGISHLHMYFSGRPDNPFRDVRLRRAASMALDRELFAEVLSEAETLRSFGLPPTLIINNNIPGGAADYWLDPTGKEMGQAAQYFKFDQAESKKLMAAAGYANGIDVVARVSTRSHGAGKESEIALQMLQEVGFRVRNEPAEYNTVYVPNIISAKGDWDGHISFSGGGMGFSPATGLFRVHHPAGGTSRVSWRGAPWDADHKRISDAIDAAGKEIDQDRYKSRIYDLQRDLGMFQGAIIVNFSTGPFTLVWPWVKNWNTFRLARETTGLRHVWIDDTLKS